MTAWSTSPSRSYTTCLRLSPRKRLCSKRVGRSMGRSSSPRRRRSSSPSVGAAADGTDGAEVLLALAEHEHDVDVVHLESRLLGAADDAGGDAILVDDDLVEHRFVLVGLRGCVRVGVVIHRLRKAELVALIGDLLGLELVEIPAEDLVHVVVREPGLEVER